MTSPPSRLLWTSARRMTVEPALVGPTAVVVAKNLAANEGMLFVYWISAGSCARSKAIMEAWTLMSTTRSGSLSMSESANGLTQAAADFHRWMKAIAEAVGTVLVDGFHYLALFAIGATTVWSAVAAFLGMAAK